MIVFGTRRGQPGYAFEILKLKDRYRATVEQVSLLKLTIEKYLMHNCDFGGGAYFRSIEAREQHVFYDAVSNQLLSQDNPAANSNGEYKLMRVVNSRRGDYAGVFYKFSSVVTDIGIYLNMIKPEAQDILPGF